jgi:hypothetical protein
LAPVPPAAPPTEAELRALAEQALEHAGGGEAQATAWWERMLQASGGAHLERAVTSVEVLVVIDGRPGVAVTSGLEAADLLGAAGQAREAAERAPHTGVTLPPPAPAARTRGTTRRSPGGIPRSSSRTGAAGEPARPAR